MTQEAPHAAAPVVFGWLVAARRWDRAGAWATAWGWRCVVGTSGGVAAERAAAARLAGRPPALVTVTGRLGPGGLAVLARELAEGRDVTLRLSYPLTGAGALAAAAAACAGRCQLHADRCALGAPPPGQGPPSPSWEVRGPELVLGRLRVGLQGCRFGELAMPLTPATDAAWAAVLAGGRAARAVLLGVHPACRGGPAMCALEGAALERLTVCAPAAPGDAHFPGALGSAEAAGALPARCGAEALVLEASHPGQWAAAAAWPRLARLTVRAGGGHLRGAGAGDLAAALGPRVRLLTVEGLSAGAPPPGALGAEALARAASAAGHLRLHLTGPGEEDGEEDWEILGGGPAPPAACWALTGLAEALTAGAQVEVWGAPCPPCLVAAAAARGAALRACGPDWAAPRDQRWSPESRWNTAWWNCA